MPSKTPAKKTSAKKTVKKPAKKTDKKTTSERSSAHDEAAKVRNEVVDQIVPYVLLCAVIFIIVCYLFTGATGIIGEGMRTLFYGLFSSAAVTIPFFILNIALFWKRDRENSMVRYKILFSSVCLLFISILVHVFNHEGDTLKLKELWEAGLNWSGGGALGGFFGNLFLKCVGFAGSLIISISMLICFGLFLFGLTPHSIAVYIQYYIKMYKDEHRERVRMTPRVQPQQVTPKLKPRNEPENIPYPVQQTEPVNENSKFNPDVGLDEDEYNDEYEENDEPVIDMNVFNEVLEQQKQHIEQSSYENGEYEPENETETDSEKTNSETIKPIKTAKRHLKRNVDKHDLDEIFDEQLIDESIINKLNEKSSEIDPSANIGEVDLELEVERSRITGSIAPDDDEKTKKPEYVFPPVSLMQVDTGPKNTDISEELQTTAKKLVDTLLSFKVRTRIVNVSRGPTITRYELAPEEGTRVRAISNLIDDISLNLATSGVRIEAPIPGKSAVGIEVPNRVVATVYLRELIDNVKFKQASSRVSVSLGMDVAGEPIYVDIAKMPHLLIAGATGMGKSVCINSMIVSLLYKSSPDDVKLILIDPKKVEFSIYNGLPHLLVPVVSDPKKAAGSLHWAVTEMERRFALIEEAGVRDLKNYNASIEGNPEKEHLSQIVIIIDELADLMMTAKDEVEESICRLAQKARAAGMHLVIGTQRPSVDVITGLIKANIPSRIAFTVASQVDSRTILDIAGAEKLIGRGDMLYAPVGSAKPIRVQGAFVSEHEVEAITGFIKNQGFEASYDSDVIDKIERAAEECIGNKKGGAALSDEDDDGGESDPMLKSAIELAVESGKISTSLIQRRLSLGYGRAAKLIDVMERRGIVSPPEGRNPRTVLITRQQYMEMVLNKDTFD